MSFCRFYSDHQFLPFAVSEPYRSDLRYSQHQEKYIVHIPTGYDVCYNIMTIGLQKNFTDVLKQF